MLCCAIQELGFCTTFILHQLAPYSVPSTRDLHRRLENKRKEEVTCPFPHHCSLCQHYPSKDSSPWQQENVSSLQLFFFPQHFQNALHLVFSKITEVAKLQPLLGVLVLTPHGFFLKLLRPENSNLLPLLPHPKRW